jgi:hypothetical protein
MTVARLHFVVFRGRGVWYGVRTWCGAGLVLSVAVGEVRHLRLGQRVLLLQRQGLRTPHIGQEQRE